MVDDSLVQDVINRKTLLEIYQSAISAVNGSACVANWLNDPDHNLIKGNVYVVAVGKAAAAMAEGAFSILDTAKFSNVVGGMVISKYGHLPVKSSSPGLPYNVELIESAHPLPDQNSLNAGEALVHKLQELPEDTHLLMLISGGASSLLEILPDEITLKDLQVVNRWLLSSGLDINGVNLIRQQISLLKQGGLLRYISSQNVTALYLSDVRENSPAIIGSGLLSENVNSNQTVVNLLMQAPKAVREIVSRSAAERDFIRSKVTVNHHVVASNSLALESAEDFVVVKGLVVNRIPELYDDLSVSVERIVAALKNMKPGVLVAGGEITIKLPDDPGQGGRNQSLALAVAIKIRNLENIVFMAIGTDGTDGPGTDAGAIVDCNTCYRGEVQGLNAQDSLHRADAGSFLEASGDLISTGPTGTNVMDLYIAIKLSS